ncbi:TPA: hypothetical protein ACH3X3_000047 [Trebouxia sp. C0006]
MLRTVSAHGYRALCRASAEAVASSGACSHTRALCVAQPAWSPALALLGNAPAALFPRVQQTFTPTLISGSCRWRTGLAQRDDPVEETKLEDEHVGQGAASTSDSKSFEKGHIAPEPGMQTMAADGEQQQNEVDVEFSLMQPVYSAEYTESVKPKHIVPEKFRQKLANFAVYVARHFFDGITSYNLESMTERKWLRRILFLETVAGVPGMVGGMLRHMKSLRSMRRDNGWIHTLLEEAENERMHLLTFLQLRQPGFVFRGLVLLSQGIFFNAYFVAYVISPKLCHSFVGYLEEEAVKTYTHCISDLDKGRLPEWSTKKVPDIARDYWKLGDKATMRDLLLSVRADEACHSHVNHTFAELDEDEKNPFAVGTHVVPTA